MVGRGRYNVKFVAVQNHYVNSGGVVSPRRLSCCLLLLDICEEIALNKQCVF
jgi:hypothetical protein